MAREMKDSGIEWVGDIPADWSVLRIKYLANDENDSFQDGDWIESPVITDSGIRYLTTGNVGDGVFKRQGNGYITEETFVELNCKYAYPNDLVISRLNAPYGRACILPEDEEKYVLAVDIVILRTNHDKRFLCYVMQCGGYQDTVRDGAKGTTMKRISRTNLGNLAVPVAPIEEQRRISALLDRKCAEIDAVIAETQRTIEEYKKLKQSIINEAVTKGIRKDCPMKDSGIEWVGKIPADWNVSRLKNLSLDFAKGNGITKEDIVPDGDSPCVRYGEIYTKYDQAFTECQTRTNRILVNSPRFFSYGDLLFACTGELVDEIGKSIVYLGKEECLAGGDIVVLRHTQHPAFLNYVMNSAYAQAQKSCDKTKLKVVHISASDLANVVLAVPSIPEQETIANYLDKRCAAIDDAIAKKTTLIDEIGNYKKSIIYEYVTGKKQV